MQEIIAYSLIMILGSASYVIGVRQVLRGNYKPNLFSRAIWFLLAINSFAGVIASRSTVSSIVLSAIMTTGAFAILLAAIPKGTRHFGEIERLSTVLLLISILIWVLFDAPLVNLVISLVAHLIGGLPTYAQVWTRPHSENKAFWLLFALASLVSLIAHGGAPISKLLVPLYFTLFDGSMFLLCLRGTKHLPRRLRPTSR